VPVLVTGATGVVGRALVRRLLASGGEVRAYVRRDAPELRAQGVKVAVGAADHEGRLEAALEQVHTLVHLIGGPAPGPGATVEWLNLETTLVALRAARNAGVRRILYLAPLGADPSASNPFLAVAGRAVAAILASGLEHAVFLSAPILAPGSGLARLLEAGVPRRAAGVRLRPIAVADVVEALAAADAREAEVRGAWELGGPETVTLADLARRVRRRPLAGRLRRLPRPLVATLARDQLADPGAALARFGLRLTPLDEALAELEADRSS
jgi:uncharacterized protein YbjT (DUF2867 family)